jgi:ABC-2 type transport system permease protein
VLWYKTWLETRSRFLISLCGMTSICSLFAISEEIKLNYYGVLSAAHSILAVLWVLSVTLLFMGGLLREKSLNSSSFTLTLPVSRVRIMAVRIGMGFAQGSALIVIPWIAMLLIGGLGRPGIAMQTLFHLTLLLAGGAIFGSIALLASSIIEGEYTAPMVSYGACVVLLIAFSAPSLRPFSPWAFFLGSEYLDHRTNMLVGPIPWLHVASTGLASACLVMASVYAIQRKEF